MSNLSERDIKKSTLSFLKSYYKYRNREGDTDAKTDMRGEGGIIADGLLSYQTKEGDKFISTFEATSQATGDEVKFKMQKAKLLWDGIALGSLSAAAWLCWSYYNDDLFFSKNGYLNPALIVLSIFFPIFIAFIILFRKSVRYKYIYAIEQFKQYYANEQWISIGDDVFSGPDDRFLKELKDQCIKNGFGLIQVSEGHQPQLIITPARQDTFKNKRKSIQFKSLGEMTKIIKSLNYQKWFSFLNINKFLNIFMDRSGLSRFKDKNSFQISVAGLSWLSIMVAYLLELSKSPIDYVNEKSYPSELMAKFKGKEPESAFAIIDDTSLVQPFIENVLPYMELLALEGKSKKVVSVQKRGLDIVIGLKNDVNLYVYDCERFYGRDSVSYLVEEGVYLKIEDAIDRVQFLQRQGIDAGAMWLGCFSESDNGYALFFEEILDTREEALEISRRYRDKLKEFESLERSVSIRALVPVSLKR